MRDDNYQGAASVLAVGFMAGSVVLGTFVERGSQGMADALKNIPSWLVTKGARAQLQSAAATRRAAQHRRQRG